MKLPRVVIAGTHSGVGKTTLAVALMAALSKRGYCVQGFKVGPDYIDPGYHRLATGRFSRNLDCWLMGEDGVYQSFCAAASRVEISVIEGVMGLFDGARTGGTGSTAHVARLLKAPVILLVDVRSMGQSAAAVVCGFQNYWPDLQVAGVIINKVGSDKHRDMVRKAIERYCGVPVLGAVYRNGDLFTPERHLGLLPVAENNQAREKVAALGRHAEKAVDLEQVIKIAESAPPLALPALPQPQSRRVTVAVARDEAFNFYYQDSLDVLTACGARLVFFSPLHDRALPVDVHGVIIGGGFPEMYLQQLSANRKMIAALHEAGEAGMPIYAECGGFMYLSRQVTDLKGNSYPMAGLVPGFSVMTKKLAGMGYVTAVARYDNLLCSRGERLNGHEFHYSHYLPAAGETNTAFSFYGGRGADGRPDGYAKDNLLASYLHLHLFGQWKAAQRFIRFCKRYRRLVSRG